MGLHLLHRWNAMLVLGAYAALFVLTRKDTALARLTAVLLALVFVQIGLGVANVLGRLPVEVTALHSACAAALFLLTAATIHRQVGERRRVSAGAAPDRSTGRSLTDALPTTPG